VRRLGLDAMRIAGGKIFRILPALARDGVIAAYSKFAPR